ncbi:unnamed protein product [Caenorhabditis nigoni]
MAHIWKVTVVLPIPIMCSNSVTAEYAQIVFQLLPFCIIFTGISVVSLFVYRMEAVILHRLEPSEMRKWVYYTKYAFYASIIFVTTFSILIYPDLKYQEDYKLKMEQRFGKFKPYMWCDNCFFMNFDSKIFLIFYAFSAIATILCFYSAISALVVTIKVLNSIKTQLSDKTAAIHRNFLQSSGPYCMHSDPPAWIPTSHLCDDQIVSTSISSIYSSYDNPGTWCRVYRNHVFN